jgi:hypothetical protein
MTWYKTPEEATRNATRPRIDLELARQPRGKGRPSLPGTSITQWQRAAMAEAARRITDSPKIKRRHCETVARFVGDETFRTTWNETKKRPMGRLPARLLVRLLPDQFLPPPVRLPPDKPQPTKAVLLIPDQFLSPMLDTVDKCYRVRGAEFAADETRLPPEQCQWLTRWKNSCLPSKKKHAHRWGVQGRQAA